MEKNKFAISPSQLKILNSCELSWAFSYVNLRKNLPSYGDYAKFMQIVDKLPKIDFEIFGSVAHEMFKKFFEIKYKTHESFANASKAAFKYYINHNPVAFRHRFRDSYGDMIDDYMTRMDSMARIFFDRNANERENSRQIMEKKTIFAVETENFITGLVVKPDRTYWKDRAVIDDYKTSIKHPTAEELKKDLQFIAYSFVHEEIKKEKPLVRVYYPGYEYDFRGKLHKSPTEIIELEFNETDYVMLMEKIDEAGTKTRNIRKELAEQKQLTPGYGPHCNYCKYAYFGHCDRYTGNKKFKSWEYETVVTFPSDMEIRKIKTPKGQRSFHWPEGGIEFSNTMAER